MKIKNTENFGFFIKDKIDYEKYEENKYFKAESNNYFLFSLNCIGKYNCNSK